MQILRFPSYDLRELSVFDENHVTSVHEATPSFILFMFDFIECKEQKFRLLG
jgi:hypothetical protein